MLDSLNSSKLFFVTCMQIVSAFMLVYPFFLTLLGLDLTGVFRITPDKETLKAFKLSIDQGMVVIICMGFYCFFAAVYRVLCEVLVRLS